MEEQAIKLLQQEQSIEHAATIVKAAIAEATHDRIPVVALPDHFRMVDLEKYLENPVRLRGMYSTSSLAEFVKYTKEELDEHARVFVSDTGSQAKCIFDFGNSDEPGNCDHKAVLELKKTAPFKALEAINGKPVGQKDWAEWIEDMRDYITEIDDPSGGSIAALITKVRSIKIDQIRESGSDVGDYKAARSELESIEAKSNHGELPNLILFTCSPYHELPEQTFKMRMSIMTIPNDIRFRIQVISMEEREEETAKNFEKLLVNSLPDELRISIGSFS